LLKGVKEIKEINKMYKFRELLEMDLEETRGLEFTVNGDYFIGKIWECNRKDCCIVFGNPGTKNFAFVYLNKYEKLYLYKKEDEPDIEISDKFEVHRPIHC
jgi:hypothetical protein